VKTEGHGRLDGGSIPLIAPELLTEIISAAADIAFIVSGAGRIISILVNPHHRSFGRLQHWEGQPIRSVLTSESVTKFDQRLVEMAARDGPSRALEINHIDDTMWEFPVRYSLHHVDAAGTVLMLGRDLRPIAEMQQQLVKAQLALERDYEASRESDTRYRVLMDATRDAIVLVSMNSGRITDANIAAASLLGGTRSELIGSSIAQEFEGRRRGEFLESLANIAVADSFMPVELQARRSQQRLLVVPTMFRAAGERLLLCRLDAAEGAAEQAGELSDHLAALYARAVDGVVFADRDGVIRAANEAFLNLADAPNLAAVRGRSLADFLVRGTIDLKVMTDNARRAGHMRLYATKMLTAYESQVSVEMSAVWLGGQPAPVIGFVIRDVSRSEALRRPAAQTAEDGTRNVAQLVGASSLKEIVAETTDVVERMCIETAVELTRNNRVAAAEMLGLSRQSLYVKLRKYGLLNKDDEGGRP
jgi:transcriptional regulator PpsR